MGLENIGSWELITILLLAFFIFGPDRLPKLIADGVRMLRQLRNLARNATGDLSRELGHDIQLDDLNPKTFVRKHLLSEADEAALRKPLTDLYTEARSSAAALDLHSPEPDPRPTPEGDTPATAVGNPAVRNPAKGAAGHAYDTDAT